MSAFFIAGVVAVASAGMTVTRRHAVHALLYFVISLLAIAVMFLTLGAGLAAALQAIVYAGAIMTLFVFVVMVLNKGDAAVDVERQLTEPTVWIGPGLMSLILLVELAFLLRGAPALNPAASVTLVAVSSSLFGTYVLGVELASMVLLAGLVSAFHLGRKTRSNP